MGYSGADGRLIPDEKGDQLAREQFINQHTDDGDTHSHDSRVADDPNGPFPVPFSMVVSHQRNNTLRKTDRYAHRNLIQFLYNADRRNHAAAISRGKIVQEHIGNRGQQRLQGAGQTGCDHTQADFFFQGEIGRIERNDRIRTSFCKKDQKEYLIQVAYSIVEESTRQREFALFNVLDQSRKKIIITNDDYDFSTSTVQHLSLSHFLAMNQLD